MSHIVLRRDSWFVRWCWFFEDRCIPRLTSVCELFWRGLVLVPCVFTGMALGFGACVYFLVVFAEVRWVLGAAVAAMVCPVVAVEAKRRLCGQRIEHSAAITVAVARVKALKSRVCPIVEIR